MDLSGKEANASAREETREYVWKYWSFHADERLRTFHFYILLVTVLVAGTLAYLKDARSPFYAVLAGLALPIISYFFWRLDCRVRTMIRCSEEILKSIERSIPAEIVPEELRLFIRQEAKHAEQRSDQRAKGFIPRMWGWPAGFYDCFCWIFIIFSVLGAVIAISSLFFIGKGSVDTSAPTQNFYIGGQPSTISHSPQP